MKKYSNIIHSNKRYSIEIYDGLSLVCKSEFDSAEAAKESGQRIFEHQKELMKNRMTAYAMVFDNKRMLYYFD